MNMTINSAELAINGGKAVAEDRILIHLPTIAEEDIQAVTDAMRTTFVSGDGPACREFEKQLAEYLGVKFALFLNSATTALDLAFMVKDFPAGSEVIVPNFTYTSTALGPILNNLKIVLADVRPDNGNLDVSKLESYITEKTVAVMPIDYAGNPAEMDEINAIAKKIMREKGTDKYSFLTDNVTRGYYQYVAKGSSYVQSNINGAMGITQLARLESMNAQRRAIAEFYLAELQGIDGLDFIKITEGAEHNWHLFGLLVPPTKRFWIMDALRAEGIMANVHYTPLHRNSYYQHLGTDADFPGSMAFYNRLLRIPIYPSLSKGDQEKVVMAVQKVFAAL